MYYGKQYTGSFMRGTSKQVQVLSKIGDMDIKHWLVSEWTYLETMYSVLFRVDALEKNVHS